MGLLGREDPASSLPSNRCLCNDFHLQVPRSTNCGVVLRLLVSGLHVCHRIPLKLPDDPFGYFAQFEILLLRDLLQPVEGNIDRCPIPVHHDPDRGPDDVS